MKKVFAALLGFSLIFAFSGCGESSQKEEQKNTTVQSEENSNPVIPEPEVLPENNTAETADNAEVIEPVGVNIDNELSKYDEIISSENKNPEDCGSLTDESLKQNCLAKVYTSLALQKEDKSYCDKLTNEKDKKSCNAQLEYAMSISG